MGIRTAFKRANEVIEQSKRDVKKPQSKDELADRRERKQDGTR